MPNRPREPKTQGLTPTITCPKEGGCCGIILNPASFIALSISAMCSVRSPANGLTDISCLGFSILNAPRVAADQLMVPLTTLLETTMSTDAVGKSSPTFAASVSRRRGTPTTCSSSRVFTFIASGTSPVPAKLTTTFLPVSTRPLRFWPARGMIAEAHPLAPEALSWGRAEC
jgi:hypothetical protein